MARGSLGTLTVNLLAKTAGIEQGTRKGRQEFRKLGKDVDQFSKDAAKGMKYAAAAVTAYAAATAYAVKKNMDMVGSQYDLAKSLNSTVVGLRSVKEAARQTGIDDLDGSLNRLNRRLGAVANGGGPAANAVKVLGLNINQIGAADADEKLALIADAIKDSGVSSQQASRYLQDLGFEQKGIVNLFREGGDEIRKYRGEVERFGGAISDIDAAKIGEAGTAISGLNRVFDGYIEQLSIQFAPLLTQAAKDIEAWATSGAHSTSRVAMSFDGILESIYTVMDTVQLFQKFFSAIASIAEIGGLTIRKRFQDVFFGIEEMYQRTMNVIIKGLNFLPVGDDIELFDLESTILYNKAQTGILNDVIKREYDKMQENLHAERPSILGRSWVKEAQEAAQEAAEAAEEARKRIGAGGVDTVGTSGTDKKLSAQIQALMDYGIKEEELLKLQYMRSEDMLLEALQKEEITKEQYQTAGKNNAQKYFDELAILEEEANSDSFDSRIERLLEFQMLEQELILQHTEQLNELIDKELEKGVLSQEQADQAKLNNHAKYLDDVARLEKQASMQRLSGASQFFGNISTLMNTENRKLFEIGKAAAYAAAVVSGLEAAVHSFNFGAKIGGPKVGALMASASMVATGVQIAAIADTKFGGGATAAPTATAAINESVEPVAAQAAPRQDIYLRGIDADKMYDGAQIMQALNRQIEDGGRIVGIA